MNFNDYQKEALRTINNQNDRNDNIMNACLGLSGEVGEINDYVKKCFYQGHVFKVDKIKDELGDVMWYIALMAHSVNLTLDDVVNYNIEKLKKRYPDGFDKNRSINREENLK